MNKYRLLKQKWREESKRVTFN